MGCPKNFIASINKYFEGKQNGQEETEKQNKDQRFVTIKVPFFEKNKNISQNISYVS